MPLIGSYAKYVSVYTVYTCYTKVHIYSIKRMLTQSQDFDHAFSLKTTTPTTPYLKSRVMKLKEIVKNTPCTHNYSAEYLVALASTIFF